jgi:hypothetical protein
LWTYIDAGNTGYLMDCGGANGARLYFTNAGPGLIQINFVFGAAATTLTYVLPATWQRSWFHLAATWNAATGRSYLYYNGALVDSDIYSAITDDGTGFDIGMSAGASVFGKLIDDVLVLNTPITSDEVRQIYNLGASLAYYGEYEPTCDDVVEIGNKFNRANITNVHYYDASAGTFSNNLLTGGLPFPLLPYDLTAGISPAVGDMIYIGCDSTLYDSGPFSNVVFNISLSGVAVHNIVWEIWDGAWTATPGLQDNTNRFRNSGTNEVVYGNTPNWTPIDPGVGVIGYWLRGRVTVFAGAVPFQVVNYPYSVTWAHADVESDTTGGDIDSPAKIVLNNRFSAATLRTILGTRTTSRGDSFRNFLPCSDEQMPDGITHAVVHASAAFTTHPYSGGSGRCVQWNPPGAVANLSTISRWTVSSAVSREYWGTYRLILRGYQSGVGVTPATIVLGIAVDTTDNYIWTSNEYQFEMVGLGLGNDIIDFGSVTIKHRVTGNVYIVVIGKCSVGCNVYFWDMAMAPIDEYSIENLWQNQVATYRPLTNNVDANVDGLGAKNIVRAYTIESSGRHTFSAPKASKSTIAIRGSGVATRIFLETMDENTGASSHQTDVHRISLSNFSRYLGMRGDR